MFKKIRNKILLQNLLMVSAVVIVAFAVIFAITYTREKNDNREKLLRGPIAQMMLPAVSFIRPDVIHAEPGMTTHISGSATRVSPDAGVSFSVLVDSEGKIIDVNSTVDLPEHIYLHAAETAMSSSEKDNTVKLEGRTWQFAKSTVGISFGEGFGLTNSNSNFEGQFCSIRFLDITDSLRMLRALAFMLSGLTVVIIAAFFFISRFFANRAIRPMEETWEKQNRFITDASHELKTPLSVIHANCGVLYSEGEETVASQIKWVDSISRAADRMNGLVSGLIALARMDDSQFEIKHSVFDLSALVGGAVSDMEAAALEKEIGVVKNIEPAVEIESDMDRIGQIVSILLDNAIKYTGTGGEIVISLKKEKRQVICAVRNSGGDIPPDDLPHLFDRFYRGDPARSSANSGYGLGLSIAKAAAERIDAKLQVSGKPGDYTEFSLLLKR